MQSVALKGSLGGISLITVLIIYIIYQVIVCAVSLCKCISSFRSLHIDLRLCCKHLVYRYVLLAPLLTSNIDGVCHLVCCCLLHYLSLVAPWSSSHWQTVSESGGVYLNTDGTLSIHLTSVVGN